MENTAIQFNTRTSTYELKRVNDGYTLQKVAIKDGENSKVAVGEIFSAKSATVIPFVGALVILSPEGGIMNTSPIAGEDVDKVLEFIGN